MFRITAWLRRLFLALFGGAAVFQDTGTASTLKVTLSKTEGAANDEVTITVSGLQPGESVSIDFVVGTQLRGTITGLLAADANGEVRIDKQKPGAGLRAGDKVEVVATVTKTDGMKASAVYLVKPDLA